MPNNTVTGFGVHLKVNDIAASRAFYEGYLTLKPVFAYGDAAFLATIPEETATAPEKYHGVTYEIPGGAKIEIADGHIAVPDASVFSTPINSPKLSAMLNVTSLAKLLQSSEIRPSSSVKKYYWGTLEMVLRDPDGWVIVLIAPYSDDEQAAIEEYVKVDTIEAG